ncbi:sugar-binding protein [Treponema sp. R80B11-R83G3]
MRKIFKIGIALFAAIAILGIISCSSGSDKPEKKPPVQPGDTSLSSVKFGTIEATLGTPAATLNGVTAHGNVVILQANTTVTATATDSEAEIGFWTYKADEDPDFWQDPDTSFATGDILCIEVKNGKNKSYYKIDITLADVALATLNIGVKTGVTIPAAGATWQSAVPGTVLFSYVVDRQPTGGLQITATPVTATGTVKYGHAVGTEEPTFNDTNTITFADGEYLYIEVTSATGAKGYYKLQINFMQIGDIYYGTQEFNSGHDQPSDLTVWDNSQLQTYPIVKLYNNDCSDEFKAIRGGAAPEPDGIPGKTTAWAKALWDEEGLTVYVDVTDPDMSDTDNEHNTDSFELFVNEGPLDANGAGVYSNSNPIGGGSQYRLALNGQVSGEGGSPAAMRELNKWASWKKADGSGYIVILKAPWRLREKFFDATTYRNDWEFGFELQINTAPVTGSRYGVIVWNNVDHTNYQNATDYGRAVLKGGPATPSYPALAPTITTQPQGTVKAIGETFDLTVAASTPKDGGTISYEWFEADAADGVGTSVGAGTPTTGGSTYSGTSSGTKYYYANVKNTVGTQSTITKSAVAGVIDAATVIMPTKWVDKVTTVNTNAPVYGFNIPAGKKLSDFTKVKFSAKLDGTTYNALENKTRRARVWGPYDPTKWDDPSNTYSTSEGLKNTTNDGLLASSDGGTDYSDKVDEWNDYDWALNALSSNPATAQNATGVTLLSLAFAPPGGGSGVVTFYIREITLENADGTLVVPALHPDHPLVLQGWGANAYATQNGNDKVTRKLYDWIDKVDVTNTAVPVFGFNLPTGAKLGDYTKVSYTLKADSAANARLRVWGNYGAGEWADPTGTPRNGSMGNAGDGKLIGSSDGGTALTTDWKTDSRTFNNINAALQCDKNATGVVLLAIGPVGPAGGSLSATYYIKDITLENDDGTKVVKAMLPNHMLLWGGKGAKVFVAQAGTDNVVRTLQEIDYADY